MVTIPIVMLLPLLLESFPLPVCHPVRLVLRPILGIINPVLAPGRVMVIIITPRLSRSTPA
jgi:hypothetical protein